MIRKEPCILLIISTYMDQLNQVVFWEGGHARRPNTSNNRQPARGIYGFLLLFYS
ncbi:hypothetical protein Hanom_Chr11g00970121 [Helianthus anomalus]